jgi:succinate dehydrogenase / fumarate reductase membrane anchor subunit
VDRVSQAAPGLRPWLLQRISAVYLAGFLLYLAGHFLLQPHHDFAAWQAWLGHPLMRLAGSGFILAMVTHSWVGLRDIILDYANGVGWRLLLLTLVGLVLGGCGLWALRILLLAGG